MNPFEKIYEDIEIHLQYYFVFKQMNVLGSDIYGYCITFTVI